MSRGNFQLYPRVGDGTMLANCPEPVLAPALVTVGQKAGRSLWRYFQAWGDPADRNGLPMFPYPLKVIMPDEA
jgi:hypothetical protein